MGKRRGVRLDNDPIEAIIIAALDAAGIAYERDVCPSPASDIQIDFRLQESGVYIECKQFHAARVLAQMELAGEIIVIQGKAAAETFAALIGGRDAAG